MSPFTQKFLHVALSELHRLKVPDISAERLMSEAETIWLGWRDLQIAEWAEAILAATPAEKLLALHEVLCRQLWRTNSHLAAGLDDPAPEQSAWILAILRWQNREHVYQLQYKEEEIEHWLQCHVPRQLTFL